MNQTQKIIKYAAIVFGIFLAVNIILAIVAGAVGLLRIGIRSRESIFKRRKYNK